MLVFRQLFDPTSSTYTYLLGCSATKEAVLIDPVFEQVRRDAALIGELGLRLLWSLETHVHADHVTGAWLMKQRLDSQIALAEASGAAGADRLLQDGDRVSFGRRSLEVRATPGHTNGCVTYVLDDESMAFTGDCVLIRGSGRTDFQQGDARALYRSVRSRIFCLPETCLLYPAHDYRGLTATSVAPRMWPSGPVNSLGSRTSTTLTLARFSSSQCGSTSQTPPKVKRSGAQCGSSIVPGGTPASLPGWPQRRLAGTASSIFLGCGRLRFFM